MRMDQTTGLQPRPSAIMRRVLALGFALVALKSVCLAGSSIDGIVVAEQTVEGARLVLPTPEHPVYYVAYDAGYIEGGSPIGGLTPPAAAAIGTTLRAALRSAGYEAAPAQTVPSLVLVYHWGSIRPGFPGQLNREARLSLVAPVKVVRQALQFLADGRRANAGYVAADLRSTLELAQGAHYFVIVSAYDFAGLTRHVAGLQWRVRLSTQESSGSMDEVLPALIGSSGPYLGRGFDSRQNISAPLLPRIESETKETPPPPAGAAGQIDAGVIQSLMQREHDLFSGGPAEPVQKSRTALSPAILKRIATYQQERAALQSILTEKIRSQTPGSDTSRAIDSFCAENSRRIAALGQLGESIRSELAQLKTANSPPTSDQPLDALLREFASDIQQLEHLSSNAH